MGVNHFRSICILHQENFKIGFHETWFFWHLNHKFSDLLIVLKFNFA